MFSAGASGPAGPPTPQAAAGFLRDYEIARAIRFSPVERTLAQAVVRWSLAYTAQCDVTQAHGGPFPPGSALDLLTRQRGDYVDLDWWGRLEGAGFQAHARVRRRPALEGIDEASVDPDISAGDVGGAVTGEEDDKVGDLLGPGEPVRHA